ncbi:MAG: hypothetical protein ACRCSK_06530 [Fusobacteriaceae bacterium]
MKKIIIGMFLVVGITVVAQEDKKLSLYPVIGFEIPNTVKYTSLDPAGETPPTSGQAYRSGWSLGLEALYDVAPLLEAGVGFAFQSHAEQKKDTYITIEDGKEKENSMQYPGYSSVPIYVAFKVRLLNFPKFHPYIKLDGGYSLNFIQDYLKNSQVSDVDNRTPTGAVASGDKVENGFYYGAGLGFIIFNTSTEFSYLVNQGKYVTKDGSFNSKLNYSRFAVTFAWKISL